MHCASKDKKNNGHNYTENVTEVAISNQRISEKIQCKANTMTEQNRRRERRMINKTGVQRKSCKNEEEKLRN